MRIAVIRFLKKVKSVTVNLWMRIPLTSCLGRPGTEPREIVCPAGGVGTPPMRGLNPEIA
jgi:NAD(P)H-flavin reductase